MSGGRARLEPGGPKKTRLEPGGPGDGYGKGNIGIDISGMNSIIGESKTILKTIQSRPDLLTSLKNGPGAAPRPQMIRMSHGDSALCQATTISSF